MKKMFSRIASGSFAALLVLSLSVTALAASGQVRFNEAGIIRFGETVLEPGKEITAPNGQNVPGVITYTDAAGGTTNYIALQKVSELTDTPVNWNAEKRCVVLGGSTIEAYGKKDGTGGKVTTNSDTAVITIGGVIVNAETDSEGNPVIAEQPVIGTKAGTFTEIDPAAKMGRQMSSPRTMKVQAEEGIYEQRMSWSNPNTIGVLSITNNGTTDQVLRVWREPKGSLGYYEPLTPVYVHPGQTMTRAFLLAADADVLASDLTWSVDGKGLTDIAATTTYYQR